MLSSIFSLCVSLLVVPCRGDGSGAWNYSYPEWEDVGYPKCAGKFESPIAVSTESSTYVDMDLQLSYQLQTDAALTIDDKTLKVAFPSSQAGSASECITSGSYVNPGYRFEQMHFHWGQEGDDTGSEHSVNGTFFPLEVHLVHYRSDLNGVGDAVDKDKGLLVIGTLFYVDDTPGVVTSPILSQLEEIITSTGKNGGIAMDLSDLSWDLQSLLPSSFPERFFTYQGSLTTPTCDQSVTWVVAADAAPITSEQLAMFQSLMQADTETPIAPNYRPLQELNAREVLRSFKTAEDDVCSSGGGSSSASAWSYDGDNLTLPLYFVIAVSVVTFALCMHSLRNSVCWARRGYSDQALLSEDYPSSQSMPMGSRDGRSSRRDGRSSRF